MLLIAFALTASACASVSVRAVVRDQEGSAVPDSTLTVTAAGTHIAVANATSDANGCVHVFETVDRDQQRFTLEIRATGFKPARLAFSRHQQETLLVTLAPTSEPADSGLRTMTRPERSGIYDFLCVPMAPPSATSLGLR